MLAEHVQFISVAFFTGIKYNGYTTEQNGKIKYCQLCHKYKNIK